MGVAEIKNRILSEAEEKAKKRRQETEKETKKLEAEAQLKAAELRGKILAQGEKRAEEEMRAILTPVRLQAKKILLEEKHRLMAEVFAGFPPEVREKKEIEVAKFLYG
jgi:vacuolar-type H+-ATPase subunit E/Vma4